MPEATGKTATLLDALVAKDTMSWAEMREVVGGSNRSLCAVYRRARAKGWIQMVPGVRDAYRLTTAGAAAGVSPGDWSGVRGGDQ